VAVRGADQKDGPGEVGAGMFEEGETNGDDDDDKRPGPGGCVYTGGDEAPIEVEAGGVCTGSSTWDVEGLRTGD
jgi:hypothetical protein